MKGLVKAIGRLKGVKIEDVNIDFDDSIIEDKVSERQQDRQDVAMGVMPLWEYRVKWYGEDEETAKSMIPEQADIIL